MFLTKLRSMEVHKQRKMRKIWIVIILVTVAFLSGCSEKKESIEKTENKKQKIEEKSFQCTLNKTMENSTKLDATYSVFYKGEDVTKLNTEEIMTSSNSTTLELYQEQLENLYQAYRNIEYYDNEIRIEGNKLYSITKIDYERIDMNRFLEINEQMKSLIDDGKLKVLTLKAMYQTLGITCQDEE